MLQSVRKYTQGWIATVMGIILSFAFILWGIENYLHGSAHKDILAKVNGQPITSKEVESDFERMIMRFKEQVGANIVLPPIMQQQLKQQALNNLIIENVLVQAAYKAGFRVTTQEISAMIKQMPAFQEQGQFSRERFNNIIGKLGYTQQQFFNEVSQTSVLNQVASGIVGSAFVLPNELNQAIALIEQKRDIEYAIIPKSIFYKFNSISESQVNSYYQQHKSQFKIPAKIQIEYLQLSTEEMKKGVSVSRSDIENYFNLNPELDKSNPKNIQKAKEALIQQKVEQAFQSASDKLTNLTTYAHPYSLNEAASELGINVNTSEYFTEAGGTTPLTKNAQVAATAFNTDIFKNHSNSNLIELYPGNVVVIRVKNYQPEAIAPLKDVQEKIKTKLGDEQASQKAKQKANSILSQINNKDDFKKILSKENLTLVSKRKITRYEKQSNPEVLKLAFSISPATPKRAASMQISNGDFAIVVVTNSTDMSIDKATQATRESIGKLYSDTYGKLEYNLYSENQLESAKIKLIKNENTSTSQSASSPKG